MDEVYVDLNSLLHQMSRASRTEAQLLRHIRRNIGRLWMDVSCRGSLYIALDGVASVAKADLQRKRRVENADDARRRGTFDARQFTPGCLLMTQ